MIVRFTTFRHRSMIYRARKNSNQYKIKLDLTKRRMHLLKQVNEKLDKRSDSFAFCDLNCRPCWFNHGTYKYFNSMGAFEKLFKAFYFFVAYLFTINTSTYISIHILILNNGHYSTPCIILYSMRILQYSCCSSIDVKRPLKVKV